MKSVNVPTLMADYSQQLTDIARALSRTAPDYSQQLTQIAQVLNRHEMPVWVVSLISAGLGAFAGVVAEPLKEQAKNWAAIRQVRLELGAAIARNHVCISTLRFIIDQAPARAFFIASFLVGNDIRTEQLAHILETKKELLFRHGQYENLKRIFDALQVTKNTIPSTEENRQRFTEAVRSADIYIRDGSILRRLRGLRYRTRMREELEDVEKLLRAFAKNDWPEMETDLQSLKKYLALLKS